MCIKIFSYERYIYSDIFSSKCKFVRKKQWKNNIVNLNNEIKTIVNLAINYIIMFWLFFKFFETI